MDPVSDFEEYLNRLLDEDLSAELSDIIAHAIGPVPTSQEEATNGAGDKRYEDCGDAQSKPPLAEVDEAPSMVGLEQRMHHVMTELAQLQIEVNKALDSSNGLAECHEDEALSTCLQSQRDNFRRLLHKLDDDALEDPRWKMDRSLKNTAKSARDNRTASRKQSRNGQSKDLAFPPQRKTDPPRCANRPRSGTKTYERSTFASRARCASCYYEEHRCANVAQTNGSQTAMAHQKG
ncbi:hypothetical protein BC832DRAFT_184068 [Gaertneriomyces semiglobifer]|nr:hypothetical protein BC832DRAFT_184068 [Gaertneriomyces semiglobifer]